MQGWLHKSTGASVAAEQIIKTQARSAKRFASVSSASASSQHEAEGCSTPTNRRSLSVDHRSAAMFGVPFLPDSNIDASTSASPPPPAHEHEHEGSYRWGPPPVVSAAALAPRRASASAAPSSSAGYDQFGPLPDILRRGSAISTSSSAGGHHAPTPAYFPTHRASIASFASSTGSPFAVGSASTFSAGTNVPLLPSNNGHASSAHAAGSSDAGSVRAPESLAGSSVYEYDIGGAISEAAAFARRPSRQRIRDFNMYMPPPPAPRDQQQPEAPVFTMPFGPPPARTVPDGPFADLLPAPPSPVPADSYPPHSYPTESHRASWRGWAHSKKKGKGSKSGTATPTNAAPSTAGPVSFGQWSWPSAPPGTDAMEEGRASPHIPPKYYGSPAASAPGSPNLGAIGDNPWFPFRRRLARSKRLAGIEIQLLVELVDALNTYVQEIPSPVLGAAMSVDPSSPPTLAAGPASPASSASSPRSPVAAVDTHLISEVVSLISELVEIMPEAQRSLTEGLYGPFAFPNSIPSVAQLATREEMFDTGDDDWWPRRMAHDVRQLLDEIGVARPTDDPREVIATLVREREASVSSPPTGGWSSRSSFGSAHFSNSGSTTSGTARSSSIASTASYFARSGRGSTTSISSYAPSWHGSSFSAGTMRKASTASSVGGAGTGGGKRPSQGMLALAGHTPEVLTEEDAESDAHDGDVEDAARAFAATKLSAGRRPSGLFGEGTSFAHIGEEDESEGAAATLQQPPLSIYVDASALDQVFLAAAAAPPTSEKGFARRSEDLLAQGRRRWDAFRKQQARDAARLSPSQLSPSQLSPTAAQPAQLQQH